MKFHFARFEITALGLLMVYGNNYPKIKPYPKNTIEASFLKDGNTDSDPLRFLPSFRLSCAKLLSHSGTLLVKNIGTWKLHVNGEGDFSLVKCM